jgi:hypothetical protein
VPGLRRSGRCWQQRDWSAAWGLWLASEGTEAALAGWPGRSVTGRAAGAGRAQGGLAGRGVHHGNVTPADVGR